MVDLISRAIWMDPYRAGPGVPVGYRYWQIYINYTGQAAAILSEIEMRESPGGADVTGSGTASASGTNAGSPAYLVDNNNTTNWVSNVDMLSVPGTPAFWTYDFGVGVTKDIQQITLRAGTDVGNGNYAPNAFHIRRSSDGVTWVNVWGERSITNWTDAETRTFTRPSDYATTPQYGNDLSIGNRTDSIIVTTDASMSGSITALVNGDNTSDAVYWSVTASPVYVKFDFGVGASKVIDGFTFYQSNGAINHGTWQMAGSNDDSSYTTFPESFLLGDNTNQQSVQTLTNTTGYRYYKLTKTAGSTSISGYIYEIEFKIKGTSGTIPIIPHRYWRVYITDNTSAGAHTITGILEVQFHTGSTGFGTDVLEGGTPLGDSFYSAGFTSAGACDGKHVDDIGGNIWGSTTTAFPHWWQYDFGSGNAVDVTGVSILARGPGNTTTEPKDFAIQYSDNNSTWTTKWSVTGNTYSTYTFRHFLRPGVASYTGSPHGTHAHWRVKMTHDNGGNVGSASAIEFRATPGGSNIATGGTVISNGSYDGAHLPAYAFDGNSSTLYWSTLTNAGSDAAYIGYSFASPVSVAQVAWVATADTGQTPKTLYIQYADSASGPWTTAWGVGSSTGWTASTARLFTDPNYV